MTSSRSATAIRFDTDIYEQLKARAKELGLPVNWLVNKLVTEGLEAMPPRAEIRLTRRDDADRQLANDPEDRT